MLSISVASDLADAIAQLQTLTERQQFNFAAAKALTQTAVEVQQEVRAAMPSRFTLRRDFIVKGIRVIAATKSKLEAVVYSRDDFMGAQEYGGLKTSRGGQYLAIPTSMVRRTPKDVIRKADRPKNLGDKVEVVEVNGRKYLALKKPRLGANRQRLRLLYLLVPRANIHERLGLNSDGQRIARARFMTLLENNLAEAVATARR